MTIGEHSQIQRTLESTMASHIAPWQSHWILREKREYIRSDKEAQVVTAAIENKADRLSHRFL